MGDGSLEEALDRIAAKVIQLRDLETLREIERNFMTRRELQAFLITEMEADRGDILETQQLLAILNLIPRDLDLYQLSIDLNSEQILGFFDPETERMYVIGEMESFGPNEEITFAHEYVHALQQQHFDIYSLTKAVEEDSEAYAALSALIEGDAYVLTFQYMFTFLTPQEMREVLQSGEDTPVFDEAPYAIQKLFIFEGEWGIPFVIALLGTGQPDAINRAFRHPPVSTEQILHPEKYFQNEVPIPVSLPDVASALGSGWSQSDSDVMGEFFLRTYLETGAEESAAAAAAAGWGGDRYILLRGPQGEGVFAALIAWDSEKDAQEFFDVALVPLAGVVDKPYIDIQESRVLFIVAPTETLVKAVQAQFPDF